MREVLSAPWLAIVPWGVLAMGFVPMLLHTYLSATERRRRQTAEARFVHDQLPLATAIAQEQHIATMQAELLATSQPWRLLVWGLPLAAALGVVSGSVLLTTGIVIICAGIMYPVSRLLWRNAKLSTERRALIHYIYMLETGKVVATVRTTAGGGQ